MEVLYCHELYIFRKIVRFMPVSWVCEYSIVKGFVCTLLVYLRKSRSFCSLFFRFVLQYTFLFLEPDCLKTLVYNQCIFKNDVQFRMRNVHDFWIYVCYYTCTYKRKVYTVWTVNDVIGRIRIHIPWIYIDIYLFGYISLKTGIYWYLSHRYTTQNVIDGPQYMLKLIYSEKATKFCEISTNYLSYVVPVKSKVKISQNFVAFSEYMNFK